MTTALLASLGTLGAIVSLVGCLLLFGVLLLVACRFSARSVRACAELPLRDGSPASPDSNHA